MWDITSEHVNGREMMREKFQRVAIKIKKKCNKSKKRVVEAVIEGGSQAPQPIQDWLLSYDFRLGFCVLVFVMYYRVLCTGLCTKLGLQGSIYWFLCTYCVLVYVLSFDFRLSF